MVNLTILAGVPGCGKSTWANLPTNQFARVVSSDAIRKRLYGSLTAAHQPEVRDKANKEIFDTFHEEIRMALRDGEDVIADATSLNPRARSRLRNIARVWDAQAHLVFFDNPLEAMVRNENRVPDAVVPREQMGHFLISLKKAQAAIITENYDSVTKIASVAL